MSVTSGVNIVLYSKLQETTYDKKSYLAHIRTYLKRCVTSCLAVLAFYIDWHTLKGCSGMQSHAFPFLFSIKEKMQETNPERVEQFMADASIEVKKLVQGGFKDLQVTTCARAHWKTYRGGDAFQIFLFSFWHVCVILDFHIFSNSSRIPDFS